MVKTPVMKFEYHPTSVTIYPNDTKMKFHLKNMMTPQRVDILEHQYTSLCRLLMKGADVVSGTVHNRFKTVVDNPLETAMRTLWMLQGYTADPQNQATFADWRRDATVFKKESMAYFLSFPLYGYGEFTMSVHEYESLVDAAQSALDSTHWTRIRNVRKTDAFVTDITAAVCSCL
jgi:hypothetical protein